MWRGATFDPVSIDRELGWAAQIGFNALRTNLHYLDWHFDRDGLVDRVDRFLDIAARHGIATMLCLFDDCEFSGEPPQWGPQPTPRPGVHNSCAIGSPGATWSQRRRVAVPARLRHDLLNRFGSDPRVVVWDLYNEPGNRVIFEDGATQDVHCASLEPASHALMRATFAWAREVAPLQPLTVAPWRIGPVGGEAFGHPIDRDALALSDVVSFHAYCSLPHLRFLAEALEEIGRPIFCTEWMARSVDSRIAEQLPYFRDAQDRGVPVGPGPGPHPDAPALAGHGQSHGRRSDEEWFHDILTEEGLPYSAQESDTIRSLTAAQPDRTRERGSVAHACELRAGPSASEPDHASLAVDGEVERRVGGEPEILRRPHFRPSALSPASGRNTKRRRLDQEATVSSPHGRRRSQARLRRRRGGRRTTAASRSTASGRASQAQRRARCRRVVAPPAGTARAPGGRSRPPGQRGGGASEDGRRGGSVRMSNAPLS